MSTVNLVACPRPFSTAQIVRQVPEGGTIAEMFRAIDLDPGLLHARVFIDDRLIHKAEWEYATPTAGQFVTVRVIPTGGGGGGKDALRIVAMIGVVVAAAFTAGGSLAGAAGLIGGGGAWAGATAAGFGAGGLGSLVASVGVSLVGSLAIGALIPPAKPKLQDLSRLNLSPALSLTGTSNQLAPYAPIPRVYGRYRSFPPLAARTITETVGDAQYLRMLFCCGYGPLALSEMKIGATPIEQFTDVETEIRYGYPDDPASTLFPDDVYEDGLSILMEAEVWQQRTAQPNAREVVLEFTFPGGLWFLVHGINRYDAGAVDFAVEYRAVGDPAWTETLPNEPELPARLEVGTGNSALVFESAGAAGNQYYVVLLPTLAAISSPAVDFFGFICQVYYTAGTTANEIIDAIRAAEQQEHPRLAVSLAPGSDGTGAMESVAGYLTGGQDALAQLQVSRLAYTTFRWEIRFAIPDPAVQYEVRVKATKFRSPDYTRNDTVYWTMLRTIQISEPVSKPGLCLVALRIKATNQLNGTLDQFNLLAESILPDWNGETWLARPTSNPASIYRSILQGSANARPLPDSRVDLTRLAAFHDSCTAQGWSFNANIDYRTTVAELSKDVLAAGRASLHQQDGKFTVVEDLPQTLAKQLITPRNSWGFRGTRVFSDLPHALKVRFVNPEKDWQQDERIVYADGYSETNVSQLEALELIGITDPELAWQLARYHLAVATLRPETYEVNMDVEHLVCSRGDLVLVQHDVPLFGLITGRIKGVATDSYGRATALTLDEPCVMQAGERYGVRVRLQDNTYVQREVLNVPGSQTTVTLLSPI